MTGLEQALRTPPPPDPWPLENLQVVARLLQPMGNPLRLHLLGFLCKPHYLEEIAIHLRMSRQAARKHVKQLLEAGWVTRSRKEGPIVEYALSLPALLKFQAEVGFLSTLLSGGLNEPEPGSLIPMAAVTNVKFSWRQDSCESAEPMSARAPEFPGDASFASNPDLP